MAAQNKNNTPYKCQEILLKILQVVNDKGNLYLVPEVVLSRDWGGNSLTVEVEGAHFHAGKVDATFEELIDQLHEGLKA